MQKFKITLLLAGLAMAATALSFVGCNDDDDEIKTNILMVDGITTRLNPSVYFYTDKTDEEDGLNRSILTFSSKDLTLENTDGDELSSVVGSGFTIAMGLYTPYGTTNLSHTYTVLDLLATSDIHNAISAWNIISLAFSIQNATSTDDFSEKIDLVYYIQTGTMTLKENEGGIYEFSFSGIAGKYDPKTMVKIGDIPIRFKYKGTVINQNMQVGSVF